MSSIARDGEHIGEAWKFEKRTPRSATASMWGVRISLPYAPRSVKPTSSPTTTTTFGPGAAGVPDSAAADADACRAAAAMSADASTRTPPRRLLRRLEMSP